MEDEVIVATVLYNLRRKKVIGGKHTHFETLKKGFPGHLGKDIGNVAEDLIRKEWIITKPTSYGLQVSLSKNKIKEIEEFILRILGAKF